MPMSALRQLLRYGIVGLCTNLAGYLAYLLITTWWPEPLGAMSLLYLVAATISFFANRRWTFSHDGRVVSAGVRYGLAHAGGYAINFLLLDVFAMRMGYPHQVVEGIAILVVAVYLFVACRFYVFARSSDNDAPLA